MDKKNSQHYEFHKVGNQLLATVIVNIAFFGHGCIVGWVSPAISHLTSNETLLPSGSLTLEQVSWIGSAEPFGALLGSLLSSYITSFIGCKKSMLLLSIPAFLFWFLVAFGNSYYYLLLARILSGLAGGGFFANIVLFVAEISNDKIRGALGTISQLARNVGILISYIAGVYFSYETIPFIFIGIPIVFLILFAILPNTPQYYLLEKKFEQAKKSLKYYKGCKGETIEQINAISNEFERLKQIELKRSEDKCLRLQELWNRHAIKGLTIGIVLALLNQLSGCFILITYASSIFARTNIDINPNASAVLLAIAQLGGNLISAKLSDKLGRKVLIIVSLGGSALCLLTAATYLYLEGNGFELTFVRWTPVIALSFSIFIASAGIIPLTTICTVEVLPLKIRTLGMAITSMTINVFAFITIKIFPILSNIIEIYGCFTIMGLFSTFGIFFVYFVMDETNGQCLDDIGCKSKKEMNQKTTVDA